jgi:hypothetical protein
MKNSHIVNKKDIESFDIFNQSESSILSVSDLNDNLIHYGIVGEADTSVNIPAHSISVKTKNGDKLSRAFDDKLTKAGLEEGDEFIASFIERAGYANLSKIAKK